MNREKHEELAVLIYLGALIVMVVMNLIKSASLFDMAYLFIVVCCVLKFFLIIKKNRKE